MHNHRQRNQTQYLSSQTLFPLNENINNKKYLKIFNVTKMVYKSRPTDISHQYLYKFHTFFQMAVAKIISSIFCVCLYTMHLILYNFVLDFCGQDGCLKLQAFSDNGLQDFKCRFLTPCEAKIFSPSTNFRRKLSYGCCMAPVCIR